MRKINISLRSSFYACVVQTLIVWIAIWAVLISALPLAASLYLLALLTRAMVAAFTPQPPEILQISVNGQIRYRNRQEQCKKAFTVFKPLMIQLTTEQGETIKVWRDCCTEKEYRNLLMMIGLILDRSTRSC